MRALALAVLLAAPAAAAPADALRARVVSWDVGWRPKTREAWVARLEGEVRAALDAHVDVLLFPELFAWGLAPYAPPGDAAAWITHVWGREVLPRLEAVLKESDILVVLGSYPHREPAEASALNRAPVWRSGAWAFYDKRRPTPAERAEDPPVRPGAGLAPFAFRGGRAAVAICYDVEMPEFSAELKREGVQLLLVPSATSGERGLGRVARTASARAVELGAAVLVSGLRGEQAGWKNLGGAALYLPSQRSIDDPVRAKRARRAGFGRDDFEIPWNALLDLRTQSDPPETRPFLNP